MTDGNLETVTFGWYGKSPAAGDFVSRRLSRPIIAALDRWFQSGMTALRERMPEAWHSCYAKAPVWRTLLPAEAIAPGLVVGAEFLVILARQPVGHRAGLLERGRGADRG